MAGSRLTKLFDQYVRQTRAQNSFSLTISKRLTLLGSTENNTKSSWEFPLEQRDSHPFATASEGQACHGGVLSTVVTDATTMHIQSCDLRERKAVSTDFNMSFVGQGKVGRNLHIESQILKIGGVLGVAEAQVKDITTGKLLAVGRHSMMFVGEDKQALKFATSLNSVFDV
mmetsp:Transcript_114754/g.180692  ORF Transcript_114754/g.180692 Transcript_114754/m.180692 type:complete len:171 (-) Transcript_114754:137-649(-)|eukprot:CAMPEP_0169118812 /NCGR_PEP_ID=MMETSP1015-20121227/31200_1 /TAXON_ID=342587 /ORGANISM="Karlodinium micrum, Strain CCMP2283" /LENGTH=170 /DNA_ID=CAMNT_0009181605 /DNA_START=58 /DNA_END=570 /DNA_ORIENTATION=-